MIKRKLFPLLFVTILAALTLLTACGAPADTVVEIQHNISVDEAYEMVENGVFVLDVRTPAEWNDFHVEGSALIPHDRISEFLGEIPMDEDVLLYCRSGNRSSQALQVLLDAGYTNVYNMLGGMNEWTAAGYPIDQ